MQQHTIHTPTIKKVDEHSPTSATFVIEPLHTGYGMTLGNSLRRILLSSIAGAAIDAFKVEGVTHEFTTLPGVKEDIVAIMLNLKKVVFRVFSDGPQTLRLEKKGKGVVKASDIKGNSEVEIVNKDQPIATLTDAKAKLVMDLRVGKGRGYATAEELAHDKPSDMNGVDALYSPVTRVRYKVENTRVGQMTNLDKLSITVETDGSITPREGFEEAAAILVTQYQSLAGNTTVAAEPSAAAGGDEDGVSPLMTPIDDLGLSARTTNALVNNDIHTVNDLVTLSDGELRELKGFGSKALEEVEQKLAELDL
jgi:DNA-directed RNA polymerase subunit alpha